MLRFASSCQAKETEKDCDVTLHREEHLKLPTLNSKHIKTSMEEEIGWKLDKVSLGISSSSWLWEAFSHWVFFPLDATQSRKSSLLKLKYSFWKIAQTNKMLMQVLAWSSLLGKWLLSCNEMSCSSSVTPITKGTSITYNMSEAQYPSAHLVPLYISQAGREGCASSLQKQHNVGVLSSEMKTVRKHRNRLPHGSCSKESVSCSPPQDRSSAQL